MKLLSVVGARPQFVKLGPIARAIDSINSRHAGQGCIEHTVIHTGQHYDQKMSDVFFREFDLPAPQINLGIGSGPHGQQTGRMVEQLERVFVDRSPDIVLVFGDTNSTVAAALAAVKLHIPVAHVEAGLRSFNKGMPEEINRVLTDHASTILFCPTLQAVQNIAAEGFANTVMDGKLLPMDASAGEVSRSVDNPLVLNVGDVMYDVYLMLAARSGAESTIASRLNLKSRDYALVTIHRAENTDDPKRLRGIIDGVSSLAKNGIRVVLPLHPRTRKALNDKSTRINCDVLEIIDPVGYLDMLALERSAQVILTDSGGVQKEAYFSGIPCVTLRDETEWVELIEAGWNRLSHADPRGIRDSVEAALQSKKTLSATPLYGDGRAAERIVWLLAAGWQRD